MLEYNLIMLSMFVNNHYKVLPFDRHEYHTILPDDGRRVFSTGHAGGCHYSRAQGHLITGHKSSPLPYVGANALEVTYDHFGTLKCFTVRRKWLYDVKTLTL